MMIRSLIALLLIFGFSNTATAVENPVQIGPDYQVEWFHSSVDTTEPQAYSEYIDTQQPFSKVFTQPVTSDKSTTTAYRQQQLTYLQSRSSHKHKALTPTYPSEDPIYCSRV